MILFYGTRIFMIFMIDTDRFIKIMTYHDDHENLCSIFYLRMSISLIFLFSGLNINSM